MSKEDKIANFDPNGVGLINAGLFGLPFDIDEAELVLIPVPWDVTVSYFDGTRNGPEAILWASKQVDLHYAGLRDAWKMGIAMGDVPMEWKDLNKHYRKKAQQIIELLEAGANVEDTTVQEILNEVNDQCAELVEYVYNKTKPLLDSNKLVGVLGGDHSTPLGLIRALSQKHDSFGILQIDAHADLRVAYEGFSYSHASIMYNAMQIENISKLVSVGVRDICDAEIQMIRNSNERIVSYFDEDNKNKLFEGESWKSVCKSIISDLPEKVYISFDIDGLNPSLCPNTGTPVPGGLSFEQAVYLIKEVVSSGKTVIGFDLCEVVPSKTEWDTNVAARLLYHLCNQTGASNGKIEFE